jgi:hypothetical protein
MHHGKDHPYLCGGCVLVNLSNLSKLQHYFNATND